MSEASARFDVQPSVSNHFAWLRTQLGLQRTLMAAVRTAVSLIGFGFTVAQFFQRVRSNVAGLENVHADIPRNLGLILIGAGVVSLGIFIWQYHKADRYLRSGELSALAPHGDKPLHSSSQFIAYVVVFIGIVAFGSVFLRF